jgi:hypothetical protein
MKKNTILFSTLLLIIFATGCTINVDVEDDDLDQELAELLDNVDDMEVDINIKDDEEETDDEEVIEPTGATEGPITVTIEEGTNVNEYLTYLKRLAYEEDWFDYDSDSCQYFYKMKADESYPMTTEDFDSEEIQAALLEILEDEDEVTALVDAVISHVNDSGQEARQICSGRNSVFVIFSESHTAATLTAWDDEALTLEEIETFEGLIDLSYRFEVDAFDSKSVMMTGYGDAGHISWNFYLVYKNNSITKVESCAGNSSSSGERGEYHDQFTFECELEYTG